MFTLASRSPACLLLPNARGDENSTATTHCRPSQQNGSSGGEAGNGGGSFSHCVEPQTHGSQQGGSSVMCAGGPPSPGGKFETQVMQDNGGDSSGGGGSGGGGGGGGGGGDGGGGFMGDAVLTMISGSPEYSQQLDVDQRRRRQQQHQMQMQQHQQMQHEQQMQLQHQQQTQHQQQQQQQSSARNSLGGHWPPSQGQGNFTEEWGVLLNRSSTPTMGTTTQVPNGFRCVCIFLVDASLLCVTTKNDNEKITQLAWKLFLPRAVDRLQRFVSRVYGQLWHTVGRMSYGQVQQRHGVCGAGGSQFNQSRRSPPKIFIKSVRPVLAHRWKNVLWLSSTKASSLWCRGKPVKSILGKNK